jgi:hypothetical protein
MEDETNDNPQIPFEKINRKRNWSLSSIKKILKAAESTETGENSHLATPTKEHVPS